MDAAAVTGFFADAYRQAPPWEIGRPHEAVVALQGGGEVRVRLARIRYTPVGEDSK